MRECLEVEVKILRQDINEHQAYRFELQEILRQKKIVKGLTNAGRGNRCQLERSLRYANYTLSRFRSPEQYEAARWRDLGRAPTKQEWLWYYESLGWLAEIRAHVRTEMSKVYAEEIKG
jgi:hypothetical protein